MLLPSVGKGWNGLLHKTEQEVHHSGSLVLLTCAVQALVNTLPIRGDRRPCQANQHDHPSRIMY